MSVVTVYDEGVAVLEDSQGRFLYTKDGEIIPIE